MPTNTSLTRVFFVAAALVPVLATSASCGDDAVASAAGEVAFHGEHALFPGFNKDTGHQPGGSPVQLRLAVSVAGKVAVDAIAFAGGGVAAGKAGTGKLLTSGGFKLEGSLKVDQSGLPKYDGPIPGFENIDIAFNGTSSFDPFAIGGNVKAAGAIPETKLPPIPLPGGLTGRLEITIAAGSVVTTEYSGTCASVENGNVRYLGEARSSAHLVLKPAIVVKLPVGGDKSFAIPDVEVDIPALARAIDLGSQPLPAGPPPSTTGLPPGALARPDSCSASLADGGAGSGPGQTAEGGSTTPGACHPSTHAVSFAFKDPLVLGACPAAQLEAFIQACAAPPVSAAACAAWKQEPSNATCAGCVVTSDQSPKYGAYVERNIPADWASPNIGGYYMTKIGMVPTVCGAAIQDMSECVTFACQRGPTACSATNTVEQSNACLREAIAPGQTCQGRYDTMLSACPLAALAYIDDDLKTREANRQPVFPSLADVAITLCAE